MSRLAMTSGDELVRDSASAAACDAYAIFAAMRGGPELDRQEFARACDELEGEALAQFLASHPIEGAGRTIAARQFHSEFTRHFIGHALIRLLGGTPSCVRVQG